jgi:hypothetical protein
MSWGVWPLSAGIDFEHVKVDLTLISQLKVPLPNFCLCHEDEEDDVQFPVRVEQEARNIMGGYTSAEHEACIVSLPNNSCLNRVLDVAWGGFGPRPVPISTEVLKKRKADAAAKVLAKRPKVAEKKSVGLAKISGSCGSGSSKRPSSADILLAKSTKLSKGTIPHAVASAATTRILNVSTGAGGAKGGERCPGYKTMLGGKATPSTKKRIIPAIGALAALSSDGTEESSRHE